MKIAVVGSRNFCDMQLVRYMVEEYFLPSSGQAPYNVLVSGSARGVDSCAEETAKSIGAEVEIYIPEWDRLGKSAGFIRNRQIIDAADMVLAFWDGESKGTKNSIDLAVAAKKPINIYIRRAK